MILGVGVDVCDVRRIRRSMSRAGFARRVFDAVEIRDCERRRLRHQHYAVRFAAKEAYFKALGTGWGEGVGWREVGVRRAARGAPLLRVSGTAARRARGLGVTRSSLSLSHDGDYAVAIVILEGRASRRARPRRS